MEKSEDKTKTKCQNTIQSEAMDDITKAFVKSLSENVKKSVAKDMSILRRHNILCK